MNSLWCQRYLAVGLIGIVYYSSFGTCVSNPAKGSPLAEEIEYSSDSSCDAVTEDELNERFLMMNSDGAESGFVFKATQKPPTLSKCRMTSRANMALSKKALHFRCSLLSFKLKKEKCNRQRNKIEMELEKCRGKENKAKHKKAKHKKAKYHFETGEGSVSEGMDSQCHYRGTADSNGLLRLCTECTSKRILGENRFPNWLTERSCSSIDADCLVGDGECVQQRSTVLVLRRTGRCLFCNGSRKEEWVPEILMIDSGCSCGLRPGSVFSLFLQ